MEYPIRITILAIATVFFINFSTAEAMEEKMEFELPESGTIINFGDSVPDRPSGGLDPPSGELNHGTYEARFVERFEMAESGIVIDFNRIETDNSAIGFSLALNSDPSLSIRTAPATQAFRAFEMSESGHLIVFPREVELRRKKAAQMQSIEGVVADKH